MQYQELSSKPFPLDVRTIKAYRVIRRGIIKNGKTRIISCKYKEDTLLNVEWSIPGITPSQQEIEHFYNMQQGSPEWLAKRNRFLTSTVVLVIVCVSSFNGPTDYWKWLNREYSSIKPEIESLRIMGHGTFHEDPVRKEFNRIAGTTFHEVGTIVCKQIPGMACNVDGVMFDESGKLVKLCEIKCPVFQPYKDVLRYGRPPISHFTQCQINMNITNCEEIYYIMCHIPNSEMSEKDRASCKRGYYYRYLEQNKLPPGEALTMPLEKIPKTGLLYCISVKRSQKFWSYITAHVRKFWTQNVLKFQPPIEDASTGKRDYSWFIEHGILSQEDLDSLFTPVYVELAVNIENDK